MASVNKAILIGHLGRDPELRHFANGDAVTNVSIATTETWKDKNSGEKKEATEWHNLVFHRKLAEVAADYLKKGSQIYVEGSIRTRKWKDKEGQERYTTEIVVDQMKMLGGRTSGIGGSAGGSGTTTSAAQGGGASGFRTQPAGGDGFNDFEDDIPF